MCIRDRATTSAASSAITAMMVQSRAGGLGQRMDESMKMLAGAEVSSMLLVFVLLVALADLFSKILRRRLG